MFNNNNNNSNIAWDGDTVALFALIIVSCVVLVFSLIDMQESDIHKIAADSISNGYSVYVNGIEVDAENIRIEDYSHISIDDENRKVILTSGHSQRTEWYW